LHLPGRLLDRAGRPVLRKRRSIENLSPERYREVERYLRSLDDAELRRILYLEATHYEMDALIIAYDEAHKREQRVLRLRVERGCGLVDRSHGDGEDRGQRSAKREYDPPGDRERGVRLREDTEELPLVALAQDGITREPPGVQARRI
jgi:hypothetical protein